MIFTAPFPVWQGATYDSIARAILKHYYYREIGQETPGMWIMVVNRYMSEIMPRYVQIGNMTMTMGNVWDTNKITETTGRVGNENRNGTKSGSDHFTTDNELTTTNTSTADSNGSGNQTVNETDKFSDTPQNGLQSVEDGTYLTNASVNDNTTTSSSTNHASGSSNGNQNDNKNEERTTSGVENWRNDYNENVSRETIGFAGNKIDMMVKGKEAYFSIIEMIIADCACLYMGVF